MLFEVLFDGKVRASTSYLECIPTKNTLPDMEHTALRLEEIIRRLFDYPIRGRMAGYIDADHFEREPFDAALIALSPVWERVDKHELDAFLSKWDTIFRDNDYHQLGPVNEEEYVSELENLLKNAVVTR